MASSRGGPPAPGARQHLAVQGMWRVASSPPAAHRVLFRMLLVCPVGASAAACGYHSRPAHGGHTEDVPAGTPSRLPHRGLIKSDWDHFFTTGTPVSQRSSLLRDGRRFSSIIGSQAHSPLAAHASALVTRVVLVSATRRGSRTRSWRTGSPCSRTRPGSRSPRVASGKLARPASAACWRWTTGERPPGSAGLHDGGLARSFGHQGCSRAVVGRT